MGSFHLHRRLLVALGLPSLVALTTMPTACGGDLVPEGAPRGAASAITAPVKPLAVEVNLEDAYWRSVQAPYPLFDFAVAPLDDGRVLVTGGMLFGDTEAASVSHAYLFDAGKETWTKLPPMSTTRSSHTATKLLDGRVLVAGGESSSSADNEFLDSSQIFDLSSSNWQTVASKMGTARGAHTATLLSDGRVITVGGSTDEGRSNAVDIFTPDGSGAWSPGPTFSDGLIYHTATLLEDDALLVTGGHHDSVFSIYTAMVLENEEEAFWSERSSLVQGRANHRATRLSDGRVLVTGGRNSINEPLGSAEIYGPSSEIITPLTFSSVDDGAPVTTLASPNWYFIPAATMSVDRAYHTAALLPDGRVLVVGGKGMNGATQLTEIYEPSTNSWQLGPELKFARSHHEMVVIGARTIVFGGLDRDGDALDSVEILDFGKKLGDPCEEADECSSGFCVDGICCDTSCESGCVSCLASQKESGPDGYCGPTPLGTNPRGLCTDEGAATCGMSGTCDGQGACAVYEDGTSCGDDQFCSSGVCQADPGTLCTSQKDGASCGDHDGCSIGICRDQVCETTHRLDGSPCEGGVCVAGECKLDRQRGPNVDEGEGSGSSDGKGPGSGASIDSASSDANEEGGGLCSTSLAPPKSTPMAIGLALIAGVGALRRRSKSLENR